MKGSRSAAAALISLVILGAALVVLGTLQYRWIGQMADAERQRMRAGIDFAAHHYSDDLDHELTRMFFSFQIAPPEATPERLLHRYDEWAASTRDPHIVKAIYYVPPNQLDTLQRIDPAAGTVRPVPWPATLATVKPLLAAEIAGGQPSRPIVPRAMAMIVPCGIPRMVMERHHQEMALMTGIR